MISINEFRSILGGANKIYSDEQLEEISGCFSTDKPN
jgi:hypothetical protein